VLYVVVMRDRVRLAALAGVVGPIMFIVAWVVAGATTSAPYSSIDDAISRLAAVGSDTRLSMTVGLVALGVSLPVYGWALRSILVGRAWMTATATGVATLVVAATPLDRSDTVDLVHGLAAGVGYVTLAATPILAAPPLAALGHRRLARFGLGAGGVCLLALALTTTGLPTGLFQRIGLTLGHAWIVVSALAIVAGGLVPQRRGSA
jgi:hypothetical protein